MARSHIVTRVEGIPVRITKVDKSHSRVFCTYPTGAGFWVVLEEPIDLKKGEVFLLNDDELIKAPNSHWPRDKQLGVVKRVFERDVVLETSMGFRLLTTKKNVTVDAGNTVEYSELEGIHRILSENPISQWDLKPDQPETDKPEPDSSDLVNEVLKYIVDPDESGMSFDSLGGYEDVIERAKELIETQLEEAEKLDAIGVKRVKGAIFTGPPGTGKTHLARIIANVANARFYLVSGPSIVSKWVGDSENLLRGLFAHAAQQERAIIFFDEIDSIASRRTQDSNGDAKRIVAQLLTLLDGFEASNNIIVIAATNRIEDIDEALLRPGRFDWEITFPLPTVKDRLKILDMWKTKVQSTVNLPLEDLAAVTDGWSGAMLAAIWTEAAFVTVRDGREKIADEDLVIAFQRVMDRQKPRKAEVESDVD